MKARLTLAITEEVNEGQYERHYDWIDVEVLPPKNLNKNYEKCDIIGGQWLKESEEKSMLHNATVREDKVLEEYYVIRAIKKDYNNVKKVIGEMKCTNKPTLNEIAAFLKNSGGDFVSVVKNYRFTGELPF